MGKGHKKLPCTQCQELIFASNRDAHYRDKHPSESGPAGVRKVAKKGGITREKRPKARDRRVAREHRHTMHFTKPRRKPVILPPPKSEEEHTRDQKEYDDAHQEPLMAVDLIELPTRRAFLAEADKHSVAEHSQIEEKCGTELESNNSQTPLNMKKFREYIKEKKSCIN